MATFRCKMCGGSINVPEGQSSYTCEYCGTQQTIPTVHDENLQGLFNRANVLRMRSEFDKASDIYEKIIQAKQDEAEAYWGLILCRYGIEYVEDPKTYKRIPTCHRASYDSVVADEDYKNALLYADAIQRGIYEAQAKEIDEIQHGIITIAQKEDPYDVFICYKETDENGKRTQDSVIANDIYYQLTHEGFKVFYAAISLEDKLGSEYEPYIFSALNTAKVMLVIGTKPEFFTAVWVKNEWSRFLKIMKKDRSKLLIPCYRDMDAYELPEEFAHLQAQDMSKIGFINDVVRGIKKVVVPETSQSKPQETTAAVPVYSSNVNALLDRGNMALEDHEWEKADGFFEEVLNQDAKCSAAYLGKWLAKETQPNLTSLFTVLGERYNKTKSQTLEACPVDEEHINKMVDENQIPYYLDSNTIRQQYEFKRTYHSEVVSRQQQKEELIQSLQSERLYTRALQYAHGSEKTQLEQKVSDLMKLMDDRINQAEQDATERINTVKEAYAAHLVKADQKVLELRQNAENKRETAYQHNVSQMKAAKTVSDFQKVKDNLTKLQGYKDTEDLAEKCQKEIERIEEEKREEEKKLQEEKLKAERAAAKKRKKIVTITSVVAVIGIVIAIVLIKVIIPSSKYNSAMALYNAQKYEEAYKAFNSLNYKDSSQKAAECLLLKQKPSLTNIMLGDIVKFGLYEQDNNTTNGKEEIEWLVLAVDGNKALIISKYALDCQQYNSTNTNTTWEQCSLRTWLNGSFYNTAFEAGHQNMIMSSIVTADMNPLYNTSPGNNTTDKVFLLSITEVNKYFNSDEARKCAPTDYAITQGASTSTTNSISGRATCYWWLRSPGSKSYYAVCVNYVGSVHSLGDFVYCGIYAVRPAMWIDLGSE